MTTQTKTKVAVYGTLKIGGRFHDYYLSHHTITCLGEGETKPEFKMFDLGPYPGATKGDKKLEIELYEIEENHLQKLDYLEGYPEMYTREIVDVILNNGKEEKAWIYIKNGHLPKEKEITNTNEKGRITWIN